jgi:two-component system, OmpR family, response regulator MtrA
MIQKHILVVDDDKAFNKLLLLAFQEQGFQVDVALNGEEALSIFREKQPPIILLDVGLPGISGFQVAAEIRNMEETGQHTVIVMMTAHARSYFVAQEFEIEIDGYLTKPMLSGDIVEQVTSLVQQQQP